MGALFLKRFVPGLERRGGGKIRGQREKNDVLFNRAGNYLMKGA